MAVKRVGVDVGSSAVRIAEVEFGNASAVVDGRGTLVNYAEAAVPPGAVQAGEVRDVQAVASAIKRAYGAGGFSTKEVVVGVGAPSMSLREMDVPALPMKDLRTSLPFQVQEVIPMSTDEALLDFYPTEQLDANGKSVLRGILVAAPKKTVGPAVMAVDSAGLRPRHVDLNAFALLRSALTQESRNGVIACVDIGARVTNIAIANRGEPKMIRTLPGGGQDVTDAIVQTLQMSPEEAESVKAQVGLGTTQGHPAQAIIASSVKTQIDAIRNTFVYYAGSNQASPITHVFLSGGGSLLPGLGQNLATTSRLPVSYGSAVARLNLGKRAVKSGQQGYEIRGAIAAGLAMGDVA